ncbi:MAG: metal-dependent transcriptional regulator [Candidatus Ranarchaeia archaeon]
MVSNTEEDYLSIIYKLQQERPDEKIKTTDISKVFDIAAASVTEMLIKLDKKGFIKYQPYLGVILTREGLKIGKNIKRKHRLVEVFLVKILKLNPYEVHDLANQIEHALTPEAETALCRFLKIPEFSPHNRSFIPPCNYKVSQCSECKKFEIDGIYKRRNFKIMPLFKMKENTKREIIFLRGNQKQITQLIEKGIKPGIKLKLIKSDIDKNKFEIEIKSNRQIIKQKEARKIFLKVS